MRRENTRRAMPIALQLTGKRALVVGSGPHADARAQRLEDGGASVVRAAEADYRAAACEGMFVVVANSDDAALNRRAAQDARAAGCLAYAHDDPEVSDFAMPAVVKRGPVKIAISTDATAPALSRRLREQLESLLDACGAAFDTLAAGMADRREELPPGKRGSELYKMASRLEIEGRVVIRDLE